MKKLLLTAAAVLATLNMYGAISSNIVTFSNTGATNPVQQIWVNDTGRIGDGQKPIGSAYQVALYWGQLGAPAASFQQIGAPSSFNTTAAAAGTFFGGGRTIVNNASASGAHGEPLSFQVKGWGQVVGIPNSYEAVLAAGLASGGDPRYQVGESAAFTVDTKNPFDATDLAPNLIHATRSTFQGFAVSPVPEPSVIGLGLLGVGALLMLRRRK